MTSSLYEGFEGYKSAAPDERIDAVRSWLVVLDTNVLLSLYNFQGKSLEDFTQVFESIGDRLFVPHQVMDEFWRNRLTVLKENKGRHRERERVEEAFDEAESQARRWHQRVVKRGGGLPEDMRHALSSARESVLSYMDETNSSTRTVLPETPTYDDPVLLTLERLLHGRVGAGPDETARQRMIEEAKKRFAKKIPPGYMDADKASDRGAGDYIVWRQVLDHVKATPSNVLLITQDVKEDWWADSGGSAMRARPELVQELRREAGAELLLMRPHDLLGLASEALGVEVSDATVADVEDKSDDLTGEPQLSPTQLLYKEFWERLAPEVRSRGWSSKPAPAANWWSMPAGGGGNQWTMSYASFGCRTELYLGHKDGEVNLHRLRLLRDRADEIQAAFGEDETVVFDELPHANACRIEVRNEDGRSITDLDSWEETGAWLLDCHDRLRTAINNVGGPPLSKPE